MAEVSVTWLAERLKRDDVSDVATESMSGAGGLNCSMMRLLATYKDGTQTTFVFKRHDDDKREMSKQLGLAREALFYEAAEQSLVRHPRVTQVETVGSMSEDPKQHGGKAKAAPPFHPSELVCHKLPFRVPPFRPASQACSSLLPRRAPQTFPASATKA